MVVVPLWEKLRNAVSSIPTVRCMGNRYRGWQMTFQERPRACWDSDRDGQTLLITFMAQCSVGFVGSSGILQIITMMVTLSL